MRESAAPFEGLVDAGNGERVVWDRFVRLFHWSLVAAVATALVTGFLLDASWIRLHLAAGIVAAALVMARIVWGFAGPTYARFSQFVPGPRAVIAHLDPRGHHARHVGHNPLGALMVLALLAVVLALSLTGLAVLGSGLKTGPLAAFLPAAQGHFWQELHEVAAFVILALVALHLVGVAVESRRGRENLPRAMVTGRKPARDGDLIAPPRPARLLAAAATIAALAFGIAALTVGLTGLPLTAPPVETVPETYQAECDACHMAHHPGVRTAASWDLMMTRLDDHFGEDASLPDAARAEIAAWLRSHAAETVDSKPAALWRDLAETAPVALPETDAWKRLHAGVDETLFKRRDIYSRSNCAACHGDAETGWFSPFAISIPKEKTE